LQGISGSPAIVTADDACGDVTVTVTNEPELGSFEVEKIVDWMGDLADFNGTTFTVNVTGPSYPVGSDLSFDFYISGGILYNPDGVTGPYCISDLTPGTYTVSEVAPAGWQEAVLNPTSGQAVVAAGDVCDETAEVTITNTPRGGATRTIGFWKTHWNFTDCMLTTYVGSIDLGTWEFVDYDPPASPQDMTVNSIGKLMAIMWANPAKNSDGTHRYPLDKARIKAAQQAIAAILNSHLPDGAPLPSPYDEATIAAILEGSDIDAIDAMQEALDIHNNSGDDEPMGDGLTCVQGKADPQGARDAIDPEDWADTPAMPIMAAAPAAGRPVPAIAGMDDTADSSDVDTRGWGDRGGGLAK
jgi:hypothetical protein